MPACIVGTLFRQNVQMRILIVDSSVQIIERLEEMLSESANSTIYKSASRAEAVTLFEQNKPEVVLLDIYLPGNDSINFLKEIRKSGTKTFILMLSAQPDNDMQEQYRSLGVNFFFDKYHDFEKIPAFIKNLQHKILTSENE